MVVAELVPAVVKWNRESLTDLAGSPLEDRRVTLNEADVAQMIKTAKGYYNAILLDVDNGPQALCRKDNNWLYSLQGLIERLSSGCAGLGSSWMRLGCRRVGERWVREVDTILFGLQCGFDDRSRF